MSEVAIITADELNLHLGPNGKVIGTAIKGERFRIIRHVSRPIAEWVDALDQNGQTVSFALHNKSTGEVFARVEKQPDAPLPKPKEDHTITKVLLFLIGLTVVLGIIVYAL